MINRNSEKMENISPGVAPINNKKSGVDEDLFDKSARMATIGDSMTTLWNSYVLGRELSRKPLKQQEGVVLTTPKLESTKTRDLSDLNRSLMISGAMGKRFLEESGVSPILYSGMQANLLETQNKGISDIARNEFELNKFNELYSQ